MNSSSLSLSESVNSRGFLFRLVKSMSRLMMSCVVRRARLSRVEVVFLLTRRSDA